jgi:hypothetical protein
MFETKESFLEYWLSLPCGKNTFCKYPVICNDGFTFSAQIHYGTNCNSKEAKSMKEITDMELGFPSQADDLIAPYANETDYGTPLTQDVYGYTPIDVIVGLVNKHGGLKKNLIK